jgi:hypothetical protein
VRVTAGPELDVTRRAAPARRTASTGWADGRRPALRHGLRWFRRRPPWCLIAGPVLVWPQRPLRDGVSVRFWNPGVLSYLTRTGFRFAYQADGVLVYQPTG